MSLKSYGIIFCRVKKQKSGLFLMVGMPEVCGDKIAFPYVKQSRGYLKGGWRFKTILSNSGIYSIYSIPPPTYIMVGRILTQPGACLIEVLMPHIGLIANVSILYHFSF